MKIEDLDNYCLKVTEKYMRNYYSANAQLIKNETTEYEIVKGLEIPTSVSPIKITNFFSTGDDIYGIYVEYLNENIEYETAEVNFETPITIKLVTGNSDVSRTSICTLELVEK